MRTIVVVWAAYAVALCAIVHAQGAGSQERSKPDSAEAAAHVAAAQRAAGAEWQSEVEFFCSPTPNRANRPDDPLLEPTRVFDNVYVIGRAGTAVFAITTTDGVVLIDSGYADQLNSVLLPGLKALGLDEAKVRMIILGHGHADHYGGAAYFQQKYGTHVAMGGPDWDLVEHPAPARGGGAASAPVPAPKRDVVLTDGQELSVGDERFTIVAIPGHTPGSIGVIFPVRDGGARHVAGLFGGTILIPGRISDADLETYVRSIEHFAAAARKMNADVEIQNHPLYDDIAAKVSKVRAGNRAGANPFVVGRDAYQRFLTVQSECIQAQMARRRAV